MHYKSANFSANKIIAAPVSVMNQFPTFHTVARAVTATPPPIWYAAAPIIYRLISAATTLTSDFRFIVLLSLPFVVQLKQPPVETFVRGL